MQGREDRAARGNSAPRQECQAFLVDQVFPADQVFPVDQDPVARSQGFQGFQAREACRDCHQARKTRF